MTTLDGDISGALSPPAMFGVRCHSRAVGGPPDAEAIAEALLDGVLRDSSSDRACVVIRDRTGRARLCVGRRVSDDLAGAVAGTDPWGSADARPVLISDVHAEPGAELLRSAMAREDAGGCVLVPLIGGSGVCGTLALFRGHAGEFTATAIDRACDFASLAAIALDHVRASEALRHERAAFVGGPAVFLRRGNAPGFPLEFISPNVRDVLHFSPEDLTTGRVAYAGIVAPQDRERSLAEIRDALARGLDQCQQVYRIVRPDGSMIAVHEYSRAVRDSAGNVTHLVGYLLDVTDQLKTIEDLRHNELRLGALFNQAAVGIAEISPDGRFVAFNSKLCEIFGYSDAELRSLTWRDITYAEDIGPNEKSQKQAMASDQSAYTLEKRYVRKDGGIVWARLTATVVRSATGAVDRFIAVVEDIREQKLLAEQLLQSQKMESLGRLAGGIAHDFNNLLTAITGYTSILAARFLQDSPDRRLADQVLSAADTAASLTRQLVAFSRKQVVSSATVSLNDAVRRVTPILSRLIRSNIQITAHTADNLFLTQADPAQLEQVLINLCTNAQDAMPAGGEITILTWNASRADPERPNHSLEFAAISVSDTGAGMDEVTRRQIFEPFFTTKPKGQGTGLGLSTVYGIVKQWGGEIEVSSQPGSGTTFALFWPRTLAPAADRAAERAAHAPRGSASPGANILVVEDQQIVRRLMIETLTRAGYTAFEATDGIEALDRLSSSAPAIQLVISDIVMPRLGGVELAARIRRNHPGVSVLLMSGYTGTTLSPPAAPAPNTPFIEKPFAPEDLLAAVEGALAGAAPERGVLAR